MPTDEETRERCMRVWDQAVEDAKRRARRKAREQSVSLSKSGRVLLPFELRAKQGRQLAGTLLPASPNETTPLEASQMPLEWL